MSRDELDEPPAFVSPPLPAMVPPKLWFPLARFRALPSRGERRPLRCR